MTIIKHLWEFDVIVCFGKNDFTHTGQNIVTETDSFKMATEGIEDYFINTNTQQADRCQVRCLEYVGKIISHTSNQTRGDERPSK